jgi:GMP synthase (glutamine-hydrolysing)
VRKVICGLSGGVDSSVAAVLIHEAIGDQLTCVFVDHGLLRLGEAEEVVTMFRDTYNMPLIHADESDLFLARWKASRPRGQAQDHRPAVHRRVPENAANEIGGAEFLAQGTLYPDVIESVSFSGGPSVTIKSPPQRRRPAGKDGAEAGRAAARTVQGRGARAWPRTGPAGPLHRPPPLPRPGPGHPLPGRDHREKLDILRRADAVYIDQIRKHGLYDEIWQAFAAILPMRTVGVMGDGRTYDYALALRAVTSVDGMTADYYPFTHDFLGETATRIINEVKGVNRVFYDCTSKAAGHDRAGMTHVGAVAQGSSADARGSVAISSGGIRRGAGCQSMVKNASNALAWLASLRGRIRSRSGPASGLGIRPPSDDP